MSYYLGQPYKYSCEWFGPLVGVLEEIAHNIEGETILTIRSSNGCLTQDYAEEFTLTYIPKNKS
jgi:hypothetical protein